MNNKYRNSKPIQKEVANSLFKSNDHEDITNAMVSVAFYETDWKWAQDKFLRAISK